MAPEEARESLEFHAGSHEAIEDPRWVNGFLGMLRPYAGLREESFHSVMESLRALGPSLVGPEVDRRVVSSLWGICHLARAWGVHPEGMLRRNGLISHEDVHRLEGWIETISNATMWTLEGDLDEAFRDYDSATPPAGPEGAW